MKANELAVKMLELHNIQRELHHNLYKGNISRAKELSRQIDIITWDILHSFKYTIYSVTRSGKVTNYSTYHEANGVFSFCPAGSELLKSDETGNCTTLKTK